MAEKKYLNSNSPLGTCTCDPEFKKQNLEELQTDDCNIAHKPRTSAKIDDKVKTDLKLVEPFIKFFNTLKKFYHVGCRLRPSDDMMANNYLKNKVLGQPMKALIIPEECDHIISISPRDLPGQIILNHACCGFVS
ncbi:hypothetical protein YC2023_107844 [Brassica napus]